MKKILFTLALLVSFSSFGQKSDLDYIISGKKKALENDHYGAIIDFTKAININQRNFGLLYRSRSKVALKDYNGAILDLTLGIKQAPNEQLFYNDRGNIYSYDLGKYYDAISDYTRAIELDPNHDTWYTNRGNSKEMLGDLNGACDDWKKAKQLGSTSASEYITNKCN